jgi:CPA2 family monovalent cation:H+ antiporter-2
MTSVLMIVLASASIVHFFDVPYSLGAFIAGMIISESAYKHQIESDLIPFRDLLLGIFFLSVGLLIDINFVVYHGELIVASTLFIMLVKTMFVYVIGILLYSRRTAIKTALLLSQIGEFSFVIFAFATQQNLLEAGMAQILISSVILSMLATPFIAKYISAISYRFAKVDDGAIIDKASHYHDHVIVVGFGNMGKRVVQKLIASHIHYVAVEFQRDLVYDGQARGYDVVFGNATKRYIFEALNAKEAASVIVTTDREEELLIICEIVKHNFKHVNLVASARNEREYKMLKGAGVHFLVDESHEIGDKLIGMALSCNLSKAKQNYDI